MWTAWPFWALNGKRTLRRILQVLAFQRDVLEIFRNFGKRASGRFRDIVGSLLSLTFPTISLAGPAFHARPGAAVAVAVRRTRLRYVKVSRAKTTSTIPCHTALEALRWHEILSSPRAELTRTGRGSCCAKLLYGSDTSQLSRREPLGRGCSPRFALGRCLES